MKIFLRAAAGVSIVGAAVLGIKLLWDKQHPWVRY